MSEPAAIASAQPMAPRAFEVYRNRRETRDTRTLELKPCDGDLPPGFGPGQFNMLYAFGIGESAISISGDPAQTGTLLHTVRGVGPVSKALCAARAGAADGLNPKVLPELDNRGRELGFVSFAGDDRHLETLATDGRCQQLPVAAVPGEDHD